MAGVGGLEPPTGGFGVLSPLPHLGPPDTILGCPVLLGAKQFVGKTTPSWWYGGLANTREKHYGGLNEMAERLEINYNTLHTYQTVARAYTFDNRLSGLSFKHRHGSCPA
jgi:hypothetical protein